MWACQSNSVPAEVFVGSSASRPTLPPTFHEIEPFITHCNPLNLVGFPITTPNQYIATMPAKPLDASQISHILEIERTRFTEVKDDLLEPQKVQIDACLGLWLIPDKSSRQWGRKRARQFLEAIYNDKSLGKDVFLLCAIGIVVTRLGRINLVEAVSVIRKWWRSVDHPHGLTETAEEYVQERQDAFSKIKR